MAKRFRSPKQGEDVQPADHTSSAQAAEAELELSVDGPGYADFDAHIECELEALVARWAHVAAPQAANYRRVMRQAKRHASDQV